MLSIGFYPGVWDLFHVGHLRAIRTAKMYCDVLVIGIPSDNVVKEDKGEFPIIPLSERKAILEELRSVNQVEVYNTLDFIPCIGSLPYVNVLFVGEYWGCDSRHQKAEEWIKQRGGKIVCIGYYPHQSTTAIKEKIKSSWEITNERT